MLERTLFANNVLSLYHLELDLPQTGIHTMEDQVPLPYFHEPRTGNSTVSDDKSHFQYHFLAMVALRRLIARIHGSIHGSKSSVPAADNWDKVANRRQTHQ